MYNVVFETNSSNIRKEGIFGHIRGAITVEVIAASPHEAVARAMVLLKGHRLAVGSVAQQSTLEQWTGGQSMRDCEMTMS